MDKPKVWRFRTKGIQQVMYGTRMDYLHTKFKYADDGLTKEELEEYSKLKKKGK